MVFQNCSPKVSKQGIFGLKFKGFFDFQETLLLIDLKQLILNMTTIFSKFQPKNTRCKNKVFFYETLRELNFTGFKKNY